MSSDARHVPLDATDDVDAAARFLRVGLIADPVSPVGSDTRCGDVAELFTNKPDLFAQPVVDSDGRPLGLLNRFASSNDCRGGSGVIS